MVCRASKVTSRIILAVPEEVACSQLQRRGMLITNVKFKSVHDLRIMT